MTLAAIVPMRGDSERVPGKNIRPFAGQPLYHHILSTLLATPGIDVVAIDTDGPRIAEGVACDFPEIQIIDRPIDLRGGMVPMNAVLMHDTDVIRADLYLQTHATNPLIRPETIEAAIKALASDPTRDSLFSVTRLQTRLWDAEGHPMNHDPSVLLRTQDLPPVFEENSCLYLFGADRLHEAGSRIGLNPLMFEIPSDEAWDIDEEIDFQIAEFLFSRRHET